MKKWRLRLAVLLSAVPLFLFPTRLAFAQANIPVAQKFDEFGDIQSSDIAARLDNFANELQAQPGVKGFIITYRSRRDLPGLSGRLMNLMRSYLIDTRGLEPDRVVGVDGGEAGCLTQELWLVPVGATPTPRSDAYKNEFEDTDSTRKFDEASLSADSSYQQSIYHSLEGFANALRKEPRARAYLVAYSGYWINRWEEQDERGVKRTHRDVNRDSPGTARRALARVKAELVKKHGVSPSRIKLMDGGYRKWGEMELWIVPRGEHTPIPTPNAFPKGRR
ncbi:MAG: hypothetical protein LC785_03815 [Acidobacteria bacterium]|nr:hypothetical protein [Acidobacteriota bacterium]MCA1641110.1 hypothetical protein [Acidobacteriota bacterium]